jgi:hypothetical protein
VLAERQLIQFQNLLVMMGVTMEQVHDTTLQNSLGRSRLSRTTRACMRTSTSPCQCVREQDDKACWTANSVREFFDGDVILSIKHSVTGIVWTVCVGEYLEVIKRVWQMLRSLMVSSELLLDITASFRFSRKHRIGSA